MCKRGPFLVNKIGNRYNSSSGLSWYQKDCGSWGCPECAEKKRNDLLTFYISLFMALKFVHYITVESDAEWNRIRKVLNRKGAQYLRMSPDLAFDSQYRVIFCDIDIGCGEMIDSKEAVEIFTQIVNELEKPDLDWDALAQYRPTYASKGWRMPRSKTNDEPEKEKPKLVASRFSRQMFTNFLNHLKIPSYEKIVNGYVAVNTYVSAAVCSLLEFVASSPKRAQFLYMTCWDSYVTKLPRETVPIPTV